MPSHESLHVMLQSSLRLAILLQGGAATNAYANATERQLGGFSIIMPLVVGMQVPQPLQ